MREADGAFTIGGDEMVGSILHRLRSANSRWGTTQSGGANALVLVGVPPPCLYRLPIRQFMTDRPQPSFGDHVRIRRTDITEAAGLAGLEGHIYGESVPSVSGVEVVGPAPDDFVLNVFVEERSEGYWLAPEYVEFLDHDPGQEIRLEGVPMRWVRNADGGWDELPSVGDQGAPGEASKFRGMGLWKRLWRRVKP